MWFYQSLATSLPLLSVLLCCQRTVPPPAGGRRPRGRATRAGGGGARIDALVEIERRDRDLLSRQITLNPAVHVAHAQLAAGAHAERDRVVVARVRLLARAVVHADGLAT